MFKKIYSSLIEHIRSHVGVYISICAAVIIGICAGAITINGLSTSQQSELGDYINGFLNIFSDQNINNTDVLIISLKDNFKIFILIFISGMTIIGIPFVYFFVGLYSYVTGFTIGVFIKIMRLKGILFSFIAILPSELFILPANILLAANAILFSKETIKQLIGKSTSGSSFKENLLSYLLIACFCALTAFAGILIESYISPVVIKLMLLAFT